MSTLAVVCLRLFHKQLAVGKAQACGVCDIHGVNFAIIVNFMLPT
jgi:hypothetical protein